MKGNFIEKLTDFVGVIGGALGYFISAVQTGAKQAVELFWKRFLPFLCFISLLIGIITASGLGDALGKVLAPLAGTLPGLLLLSFICTIPVISPILAPGAVIASLVGALIGTQIAQGVIPASWALPALFAMNGQVGCDDIPVGFAMMDATEETMLHGIPAILIAKWITTPIAVILAYLASLGMY